MLYALVGVVAALLGAMLGYWMGKNTAQADRVAAQSAAQAAQSALQSAQTEASLVRGQLEAQTQEKTAALADARTQQELAAQLNASLEGTRAQAAAETANNARMRTEVDRLRTDLDARTAEVGKARAEVSSLQSQLNAERSRLAEQIALLNEAKTALSNHFQALAASILDEKSKNFAAGSQKEIGTLLDPLRTQIKEFREKVEQAQSDSKTGVARLEGLIGSLGSLNQALATEAHNLTTALRGSSKAQGDWGEFILRDLLEKAGLREGEQYSFQQVFQNLPGEDEKARTARTDVIVLLPGGRNLIIDSKVSLSAYTDAANATTDEARAAALKLHMVSMRKHIDELAKAAYHLLPGIESPDFVVMFMPIEPAFLTALEADPNLWADAYARNILLVGPTTLLYVIRIVNLLWQQEAQTRNVREVMDRGAELYDKFVNFVGDLEKVGTSLRSADANYTNAMKKLSQGRGNLVRQAEMLKDLGVRSTKQLSRALLDTAGDDVLPLALPEVAEEPDSVVDLDK
jgi:DNA recombination protein RmuC